MEIEKYLKSLTEAITPTNKPYDVRNIEKETIKNDYFRQVLFTGKNLQLVVMSLNPNEEIGEEVHDDTDQFFRVDQGEGLVVADGKEIKISDGDSVIITEGTKHNIINTSNSKKLKLYTIYSPPHHKDKTIHKTKADAEKE